MLKQNHYTWIMLTLFSENPLTISLKAIYPLHMDRDFLCLDWYRPG